MQRLDAIKQFLEKQQVHDDLRALFTKDMELQVNVGVDGGHKVQGIAHGGKSWYGYSDGNETWKNFRIPWKANVPNEAEYEDRELTFSTSHFEAIGLTGWNWRLGASLWVGFDFDSIANHNQGLSDEDLLSIRKSIEKIPWVSVRRSTSGKGLHFYIFLDPPIATSSHTEHAALARAILGILSAHTGVKLDAKVDVCGGVLWVWHRRRGPDGFNVVKQHEALLGDVPSNWRDNVDIIHRKRSKRRLPVGESDTESAEVLITKTKIANLDDDHRKLIGWLAANGCFVDWNSDHSLLACHTYELMLAHRALNLKGPFYTNAEGKGGRGNDQNAFAFPLRNGGWVIRRHTRKTPEHPSWNVDSSGWTRTYLNVPADLATAARCHEGQERSDGRFEIPTLINALKSLEDLGAALPEIPDWMKYRQTLMKQHKDGRALLQVMEHSTDPTAHGWTRAKGYWEKIVTIQNEKPEIEVPDDTLRHLIIGNRDAGWVIWTRGQWVYEGHENIRKAIVAGGCRPQDTTMLMGQCVLHPWSIVCRPFINEYPGNRTWNRSAPQYAFTPENRGELEVAAPTWNIVLSHVGRGLNDAVTNSKWCQNNGVNSGRDYLFLWSASFFQFPTHSLPYLFFFGPQNTGKSTFHEALSLLLKDRIGYVRADISLTSSSRFNGELFNSVLCYVEETNVGKHGEAYNRIKDWVTSPSLTIHEKNRTPYDVTNTTHWIQCANDVEFCPIFPGDTRITVGRVDPPEKEIQKETLKRQLEVEGPAILYLLLNAEIPPTDGRLRVPVITSAEKVEAEHYSETPVTRFFKEKIHFIPGQTVLLQHLYQAFYEWLPPEQRRYWQVPKKFYNYMPPEVLRGKYLGSTFYAGNISLDPQAERKVKLIKVFDKLIPEC